MAYCPKCGTPVLNQDVISSERHDHYAFGSFAIAVVAVLVALIIIFVALIATGLLPIVVGPFGETSGNLQTQQLTLSDFYAIDAGDGFEVVITQGSSYSVNITTNENTMQYLDVKVVGQTLDLGVSGINFASTLKAEITMPDLTAVTLSGGAKADASGFNLTHNFNVDLSGGSRIAIVGQASDLKAVGSGGSNLHLQDFKVNNAQVTLSGGSQGTVNAADTLDADLSGGSHLSYRGNPTLGNVNTSGGASISENP